MKYLIALIILLSITAHAATPTFNSFDQTQFSTTGNIIRSRIVTTNADGLMTADTFSWRFFLPDSTSESIAPVPPVIGFNTWPTFGSAVTEGAITAAADTWYTNGYTAFAPNNVYEVQDDSWGWLNGSGHAFRDADGVMLVDTVRFPNCGPGVGLKYLADYCHARGQKFGVYVEQVSTLTVGGMVPATNIVLDAHTLASWGVDYVKLQSRLAYDPDGSKARLFISCLQTNRPIFVELLPDYTGAATDSFLPWYYNVAGSWYCPAPGGDPTGTYASQMAFWDMSTNRFGWVSSGHYIDLAWISLPDPTQFSSALITNRVRSMYASRSMSIDPMQFGSLLYLASGSGHPFQAWRSNIFNPYLFSIHQDGAARPCYRVNTTTNSESRQLWIKPLGSPSSTRKALLILNRTSSTLTVGYSAQDLFYGVTNIATSTNLKYGTNVFTRRDVFNNMAVSFVTNAIEESVLGEDAKLYVITPGYDPDPLKEWFVYSTTDYSTNSVTTPFQDPELFVNNVPGGYTYEVTYGILLTGADNVPGYHLGIKIPDQSATIQTLYVDHSSHAAAGSFSFEAVVSAPFLFGQWTGDGSLVDFVNGGVQPRFTPQGRLITNPTTSGQFSIWWSQRSSVTNILTRQDGSWIRVKQVKLN